MARVLRRRDQGYAVLEVGDGAVKYELYAVEKTVPGGQRRLVRTVDVVR